MCSHPDSYARVGAPPRAPRPTREAPSGPLGPRGCCPRISCYTDPVRNVTITLDEETARWARIEAARRDTSLSRFVGELLEERMRRDDRYREAMRRFLSRPRKPLSRPGDTYPSREELHDRDAIR